MDPLQEKLTPDEWERWEVFRRSLSPWQYGEAIGYALGRTKDCEPGTGTLPTDLDTMLLVTRRPGN